MRTRHRVAVGFSVVRAGLACAVFLCPAHALPASDNFGGQKAIFAITDEDDSYTYPWTQHTDRHYTHGIKFSYVDGFAPAGSAPQFLERALGWSSVSNYSSWGGVLGQNMYTPENILTPAPIPTDRPYAGWFYAGPVYERERRLSDNLFVLDSFEADLGMVGPDSLAGATQKQFHRMFFPDDIPQGWRNQIKNEPGLVLKYERSWRYSPTPAMARFVDVMPRAGFDLGNVFTFGTAGVTGRLGWNLPPDFGEATIDSPGSVNSGFTRDGSRLSVYVFGGLDGRAVGHNITLDGSWFRSDPTVNPEVFVADVSYGFALLINPPIRFPQVEFSFTHIERTHEFHGQSGNDVFGSLTVKMNWSFP